MFDEILEEIINNENYNNTEKGAKICLRMQEIYGISDITFIKNPNLIIDKFDRTLWKQAFNECYNIIGKEGYAEDELKHSFALIRKDRRNDEYVFDARSSTHFRKISEEEYKKLIRDFVLFKRKYIYFELKSVSFIPEPNQEVMKYDIFINGIFYRRICNE